MSTVFHFSAFSAQVDHNEVFRYARSKAPGQNELKLFETIKDNALPYTRYRLCYAYFPIKAGSNGDLDLGFARVSSVNLAKNLFGCTQICLFAATLGQEFDRCLLKAGLSSPVNEMLTGALGSERIEALCDAFNNNLTQKIKTLGGETRPRFSPGYGDLSLELQKDIFAALSPEKEIGLTLNSTLFMSPVKSVTAIIGIKLPYYFEETI